jgi:hypothetical protein
MRKRTVSRRGFLRNASLGIGAGLTLPDLFLNRTFAQSGQDPSDFIRLGNISIRTGKKLKWDAAKEEIVGDAEAAQWVHKPYRAPWKLPVA